MLVAATEFLAQRGSECSPAQREPVPRTLVHEPFTPALLGAVEPLQGALLAPIAGRQVYMQYADIIEGAERSAPML